MLIMQIGWPIATRPAVKHGSGQKNSFFHLLDLAIVNSYILLFSCVGKKISHRDFRLTLIREMLARSGHKPRPSMSVGRLASAFKNTGRLDTHHNKHWPGHSNTKQRCRVCSVRGCEVNGDILMCQVWRGTLCWSKLFWRLPYKDQLVMHLLSVLRTSSWSLWPQCN